LLALQKLKQDKEAAARSLQMGMQVPQGTIKDQLQGQVMDMTKQEVVQAVAPGLQQQGQRMAAQQAQNMMGAGLPTQPAPALQGMAQGGIVGYQEGGPPYSRSALREFDERRRLEEELKAAGLAEAEAKAVAQDPVSAQNVLRSAMNVRNMPSEAPRGIESILSAGTPERSMSVSMDALRRFDERRRQEEAGGSSGFLSRVGEGEMNRVDAEKSGLASMADAYRNAMRISGEGNRAVLASSVPEEKAEDNQNGLNATTRPTQVTSPAPSYANTGMESASSAPTEEKSALRAFLDWALPGDTTYVTPTPKGPARTVAQAVETVKNYVNNAASTAEVGGPDLLTELEYRNALRILNDNGISTEDLFRRPGKGFFGREAGIIGMGDSGLQDEAKRLQNMLSTLNTYREYGIPPPSNYPSEEEIQKSLRVVNTFMTSAAPAQETTTTATPTVTQPTTATAPEAPAATQPTTATAPTAPAAPTARPTITPPTEEGIAALFNDMATRTQQPAQQPKYRSRYEDRLAEIEAEKKNRMGALIDFLQAAGASGGTNLGATLMGGGSGLRAREERLRQQEADTLKSIIEDENTQAQREFNERQLAQQAADAAADRRMEERQRGLDRENRLAVIDRQVDATLQEVQSRLEAGMYEGAAQAKADQLNPSYIMSNYQDLVDAYAAEWKKTHTAPGFFGSLFTGSDEEYEEQAIQEGVRRASADIERRIDSFYRLPTSSGGAPSTGRYEGFSATKISE
jgi:hypothetical protein